MGDPPKDLVYAKYEITWWPCQKADPKNFPTERYYAKMA